MAVQSVQEDQTVDTAGNLTDTFVIAFTIPGATGTFTVTVPQAGDPVAAAQSAIAAKTQEVEQLLAL